MVKPWIWSDMCRERQRLRKVFKKTFKTTVFRSICRVFQQQVTHALLMLATRGQPHTAIQGQALQDEGGEFPGLQKKPESSEFWPQEVAGLSQAFWMNNFSDEECLPFSVQFLVKVDLRHLPIQGGSLLTQRSPKTSGLWFTRQQTSSRTSCALNLTFSSQTAHLLSTSWTHRCPLTIPRSLARNTRPLCPGSL